MRFVGPGLEDGYGTRPRDVMVAQRAARANALRRQQMDFMLPGNRVAGIGGQFNPTAATGFQMPGNKAVIPPLNAGKQLTDINAAPLTWQQIQSGMTPPPINTLPQSPMLSGAGMGFMIPANRPPVLKTGGPNQPVKVK